MCTVVFYKCGFASFITLDAEKPHYNLKFMPRPLYERISTRFHVLASAWRRQAVLTSR
jgi:hypothetical protein